MVIPDVIILNILVMTLHDGMLCIHIHVICALELDSWQLLYLVVYRQKLPFKKLTG